MKTFPNKEKLKTLLISRPILKYFKKKFLQKKEIADINNPEAPERKRGQWEGKKYGYIH